MKRISVALIVLAFFFNGTLLWACPQCRPMVNASVYNQDFAVNLFVLLLPLAVLFVIGVGLYFSGAITAKLRKY